MEFWSALLLLRNYCIVITLKKIKSVPKGEGYVSYRLIVIHSASFNFSEGELLCSARLYYCDIGCI